jgi:hypothetical protein
MSTGMTTRADASEGDGTILGLSLDVHSDLACENRAPRSLGCEILRHEIDRYERITAGSLCNGFSKKGTSFRSWQRPVG